MSPCNRLTSAIGYAFVYRYAFVQEEKKKEKKIPHALLKAWPYKTSVIFTFAILAIKTKTEARRAHPAATPAKTKTEVRRAYLTLPPPLLF